MSGKRRLAGAVSDLHTCVQTIANLYANDRPGSNMSRADLIRDEVARAAKIAEILWEYPPEYPLRSKEPQP